MLVADLAQRGEETGRRHKHTTLAHDGLNDDCGCVGRRALLLQDPLERVDGRVAAAARLVWIAIRLHLCSVEISVSCTCVLLCSSEGHCLEVFKVLFESAYKMVTLLL